MPSINVSKPAPTGASEEDEDNGAVEMEMNEPPVLDAALEEEIYVIIQCIDEVTKILNNADNLIVSKAFQVFLQGMFRCIKVFKFNRLANFLIYKFGD